MTEKKIRCILFPPTATVSLHYELLITNYTIVREGAPILY